MGFDKEKKEKDAIDHNKSNKNSSYRDFALELIPGIWSWHVMEELDNN